MRDLKGRPLQHGSVVSAVPAPKQDLSRAREMLLLLLETSEVGGRALKHWLHLSCTQNGTSSGLFGICSVSQQPPEGTDFTAGTAWKVLHLLPGRGDRRVPQKSCIISSKKEQSQSKFKVS